MLRYSFGLEEASKGIETAVCKVISAGHRTSDIFSPGATNLRKVSTSQMGDAIANAIL